MHLTVLSVKCWPFYSGLLWCVQCNASLWRIFSFWWLFFQTLYDDNFRIHLNSGLTQVLVAVHHLNPNCLAVVAIPKLYKWNNAYQWFSGLSELILLSKYLVYFIALVSIGQWVAKGWYWKHFGTIFPKVASGSWDLRLNWVVDMDAVLSRVSVSVLVNANIVLISFDLFCELVSFHFIIYYTFYLPLLWGSMELSLNML